MPMRSKLSAVFIAAAFLLWLPACVNLKPVPSQSFSYTLGPVDVVGATEVRTTEEPIYILRPQVPTYQDSGRLSYRLASGEVKNMFGARWAEPLAEGIARAMSLYLSESSPARVEGYYPWPNTAPEASRLSLHFQRFGATDAGEVQVVVRWTLKQSGGKTVIGQYASESLNWTVGQSDTLVAAYNEALRALAQEVGNRIKTP
jgi:uncharacterized lipoprotein YmbA